MISPNTAWLEEIAHQKKAIEAWFEKKSLNHVPPFYTSVDLRWSGFKMAPVDTNLFPAGFNNLSTVDQTHASKVAWNTLRTLHPSCKNILILAEAHTRNPYYTKNLNSLEAILNRSGFSVKIARLLPQFFVSDAKIITSSEDVQRTANYLHIGNFVPDCILLNHDLSEGYPELLQGLDQPVLPAPTLGWYRRRKSQHFLLYQNLCQEFCRQFGWDSWKLNPYFDVCDQVDFMKVSGMELLSEKTAQLLKTIAHKYQTYQIDQEPYVVIKADSGTYGMGILIVKNAEELLHLPRRIRSHMVKTKGNRPIQRVLLQEGIPTINKFEAHVAEPVVYLFGHEVIGGFYRGHHHQTAEQNLNAPGMVFESISFADTAAVTAQETLHSNYMYSVVARLAVLAASLELQEVTLH